MKVYYVYCVYGEDNEVICSNLETAKEKLKKMIMNYQIKDNQSWRQEGDTWYFGLIKTEYTKCAEGYVKEFEVIDS